MLSGRKLNSKLNQILNGRKLNSKLNQIDRARIGKENGGVAHRVANSMWLAVEGGRSSYTGSGFILAFDTSQFLRLIRETLARSRLEAAEKLKLSTLEGKFIVGSPIVDQLFSASVIPTLLFPGSFRGEETTGQWQRD